MTYEELLNRDGYLTCTCSGTSMMPLLRPGRDVMIISKKGSGRCRKYDAVLYKAGEKYILHRIIKVREDGYVIVGDNTFRKEYGVSDDRILGVLTGVVRNGKRISDTDMSYRCYVRVWYVVYPLRAGIRRCVSIIKSVGSKIKKGLFKM